MRRSAPRKPRLSNGDPRVEEDHEQVEDEEDEQREQAGDHDEALHLGDVEMENALDRELAVTAPGEHGLDDGGAADQRCEEDRAVGDDRRAGLAEGVAQHLGVGQPERTGELDLVESNAVPTTERAVFAKYAE